MSTGYDYGNARVAALRGLLPEAASIRQVGEAGGPGETLALLASLLGGGAGAVAVPGGTARDAGEALVERWRSAHERALLRFYEPPVRRLVEVLVMPLDVERVVAVLRRRRATVAGIPGGTAGGALPPGALLDGAALAALAGAPSEAALFAALARAGLVDPDDVKPLADLARNGATGTDPAAAATRLERAFMAAVERSRAGRVDGRGEDAAAARQALAREAADGAAVAAALAAEGPASAAAVERGRSLARWAALARVAHRDPLGIVPVAAYVGAVELAVVRLRAALARATGGWRDEDATAFLAAGGG